MPKKVLTKKAMQSFFFQTSLSPSNKSFFLNLINKFIWMVSGLGWRYEILKKKLFENDPFFKGIKNVIQKKVSKQFFNLFFIWRAFMSSIKMVRWSFCFWYFPRKENIFGPPKKNLFLKIRTLPYVNTTREVFSLCSFAHNASVFYQLTVDIQTQNIIKIYSKMLIWLMKLRVLTCIFLRFRSFSILL